MTQAVEIRKMLAAICGAIEGTLENHGHAFDCGYRLCSSGECTCWKAELSVYHDARALLNKR